MSGGEEKPFERLPADLVPLNYKVELRPDLRTFTFQGKLEITAKVLTTSILHLLLNNLFCS